MATPAHILLVEDDEDLASCLAVVLEEAGYSVTVVADGQAAIEAAATRPAVVLVDYHLPSEPSGRPLVEALRQRLPPSSRVLVMSAEREVGRYAAEAHADGWLEKPFDIDALLRALENQLAFAPTELHSH